MTKTNKVVVPDHVAKEIEKENQAIEQTVQETGEELDKAYVEPGLKVLDPTLLDKSALERMPTPTGWRMLILPFAGMGKSKGGIILTQDTVDRERVATILIDSFGCDVNAYPTWRI